MTITFTSGDFAGIDNSDGEFYKTTAQMRGGVSGGAAFNERGLFIGIPTAGLIEEDTGDAVGINLIRPAKYAKPLLEQAQSNPLDTSGVSSSSDSGGGGYDETQTDPRFRTCKDAKANGYGPYYSGFDPEYDWYIDADSDGKVCE
jgi:S1-C subfamily serine protease